MKSRDFCFWLQGFVELHPSPDNEWSKNWHPNSHQWEMIKRHLSLVFKHEIDPEGGDNKQQAELNAIHVGKPDVQIGGVDPFNPNILLRC